MSSAKSRSTDAPNATRQMLDELDALMERMLALPVNELEAPPAPVEQAPARPALAATLTMLEAPPVVESKSPPQAPAGPETSRIVTGRMTAPSYTTPLEDEVAASLAIPPYTPPPDTPVGFWEESESVRAPEEDLPPLIGRPPAATPAIEPRQLSLGHRVFQPLLWLNQTFDGLTEWLGAPGRWLRSARGRAALGYIGLTLIGVAIAWSFRDWLGWWW